MQAAMIGLYLASSAPRLTLVISWMTAKTTSRNTIPLTYSGTLSRHPRAPPGLFARLIFPPLKAVPIGLSAAGAALLSLLIFRLGPPFVRFRFSDSDRGGSICFLNARLLLPAPAC